MKYHNEEDIDKFADYLIENAARKVRIRKVAKEQNVNYKNDRDYKSASAKINQAKQEFFMSVKNSEKNNAELEDRLKLYLGIIYALYETNIDKISDEKRKNEFLNVIIELVL